MKKAVILILVLSNAAVYAQTVKRQVASSIKDVTVYRQGAQVSRHADVKLAAGTNELTIADLTPDLDPNTVQVKGLGSCTILSVLYDLSNNKTDYKSPEILKIKKQFEENKYSLDTLSIRYAAYAKEAGLLENYSLPTQSEKEPILLTNLKESLNYLRYQLTELNQKSTKSASRLKNCRSLI
jgi:hypothetical protein